jgi:hypothetical protein
VSGGNHIGSYFKKDKAIEALKLYNETGQCIPSDLLRRINGNGSVTYDKQNKKWSAVASKRTGAKHIGRYFTKEKAIAALKLYNETGARMDSDVTRRRKGTGSVFKQRKKWNVYADKIKIGEYFTEEKAIAALKLYKEQGKRMPSDVTMRKMGTGSVCKVGNKWNARGSSVLINGKRKREFVGEYFTEKKANQALVLYKEQGERMPSDVTMRKSGTGTIHEKLTKTKGIRFKGQLEKNGTVYRTKTYGSREQVEAELDQIINKFL